MKAKPTPSDMLEELADKVISQIDRMALTSFESTLDEMLEFHKFLIESYQTRTESGLSESFAELGGFRSTHADWISEYRRLFERATQILEKSDDFIRILAHVPLRLLPRDGLQSAPSVTVGILDLANILVHRLEDWLTQRRIHEGAAENGEAATPRLAGSDERAYQQVVMNFVGAWEDTLRLVPSIYRWRSQEIEPAEQWQRFTASWPFLQRHLQNSAYLLAVSIWNEDEVGSRYYAEMLLRWFDSLKHELDNNHYLNAFSLTPDILEKNWDEVLTSVTPLMRFPSAASLSPSDVFAAMVSNVLEDVSNVVAGVMLGWFMDRQQRTDLVPRIVSLFLNISALDERSHHGAYSNQPFLLQILRIHVVGERFAQRGYGRWLDRLVETLDQMSERPVVPGRVYSPSIRHGRDELVLPFLVCLIAKTPTEGNGNLVKEVAQLTEREEVFGQGDRALRSLLHDLSRFRSEMASENMERLTRGAIALNPSAQAKERMNNLSSIFNSIMETIQNQRDQRLKSRPIDPKKLDDIQLRIEQALTVHNGGIEIFEGFQITRETRAFSDIEIPFENIKKGYLTTPEMTPEPLNLWEQIATEVQNRVTRLIWKRFLDHPHDILNVEDDVSYLAAITTQARPILQSGLRPVLLVGAWNDPPWMPNWFENMREKPAALQVTRRTDNLSEQYIRTINDIDVYRSYLPRGQSFLFRSDLLTKVSYALKERGHIVEVNFHAEPNETIGKLVVSLGLHTKWRADKVSIIRYPHSGQEEEKFAK